MTLFDSIILLLILLFIAIYVCRPKFSHTYPLPPGPRKLPIVENLFDIPRKGNVWLEYAEMSRKFGSDIIHVSALGNSIVTLNSAKLVNDLLDKRSSIYSSRPHSVMVGELMGWEDYLSFKPYNNGWKVQRKIFTQAFPPSDIERFQPKLLSATNDLLRVLVHTNDIGKDLHLWAAAFILDVVYGIHAEDTDLHSESYVLTAMQAVDSLARAANPGAFYVEQIPILKYVPDWFPGATFKRKAREWACLRIKMTEDTFAVTKDRVTLGIATPSLTSIALEQMDLSQNIAEQEDHIKKVSATAYGGERSYSGTDTSVAVLGSFIAIMLMNPSIQSKAQSELDKVLAPGELPSFGDEPLLPYITAIVRETLRLQPPTPFAIPHSLTQDDVYEGYFIPKGTIVMPNVWSICYNEEDYPRPTEFDPSRFLNAGGKLNPDVKDPASAIFGFGRRICPGKHIATASLFIAVASILTCYTIEPELDEHGKPIEPKVQWNPEPTMLNNTLPFKCRFIPRSKEVEASLGLKFDR
ncbi:hypothetical protein GYMLUDRAFT_245326 [Collybiopsis luxurians FD-317 M1]|uniref:Unplaced genomic scaffold GYMLUscaffold_32, whole genome shotgun sequence n=1 Tax=Collybiopsis luxurians FD-317 M1 TaxID=944289 RepID=A0A0D0C9U1_9AGAR|nr:hypothetical protein GYMLUDRAFT_245326 [Collybiopsis luxurians FD-317 M1]